MPRQSFRQWQEARHDIAIPPAPTGGGLNVSLQRDIRDAVDIDPPHTSPFGVIAAGAAAFIVAAANLFPVRS